MLRLTIYLDAKSTDDYNWGVGHLGKCLMKMSLFNQLPDCKSPKQEAFEKTTNVINPETTNEVSFHIKLEDSGDETHDQVDCGTGSERDLSVIS